MPHYFNHATTPNSLLAHLSPEDFGLLRPLLTAVDLPLRMQLESRNKRIEHVYFLEHGLASIVACDSGHSGTEVGLIGREGATGLAIIHQTDRSPHETFMQGAGDGQRMEADELRGAMESSVTLRNTLLRFAHTLTIQKGCTALANGRADIAERLSRWLLMAHDRGDGDVLTLTHDFIATMLGIRRPGVTVALQLLQKKNLIQTSRSAIRIVDRPGLEALANGAYGVPEAEYRRLFGGSTRLTSAPGRSPALVP